MSDDVPRVPRLGAALDTAARRAESGGRRPDELDLLLGLAEQRDAVAGKALSACGVRTGVLGDQAAAVPPRSCLDVLREAEEFAAAEGSLFLATEHVLYALLRPGAATWEVIARSGINPLLVRGQIATEASELGRPIETSEARTRASGVLAGWTRPAAKEPLQAPSVAERVAAQIVAADAVVGLAVITHDQGETAIAVRGATDLADAAVVQPGSRFRIGSLTKVLTAMTTLALVELDVVSLDVPVGEYLEVLRVAPGPGPTLRQLLTHTGGAPAGAFLHTPGEPAPSFVSHVDGLVIFDVAPGERWRYSNIGYAIIGQALEEATGVPFERLLHDNVLKPLGMTSTTAASEAIRDLPTGYWIDRGEIVAALTRDIILRSAGGVVSTPADLALLLSFLSSPANHPRPPISAEAVEAMFEPQAERLGPTATGVGLGFRLRSIDGRPVGWHPGGISGFPSAIYVGSGAGSAVLANTETLVVAPAAADAVRRLLAAASP